jgi:uncharacterized membrane protein YagU involved in acid resistance
MKEEYFSKLSMEFYQISHDIFQNTDEKIKNMIGINMAIFPIIFGIAYYFISKFTALSAALFLLSLLFLSISTIIGLLAYVPTTVGLLNPKSFYNEHYKEELPDIYEHAAVTIGFLVEKMREESIRKSSKLRNMLWFLIIANLLLLTTFTVLFLGINICY